MKLTKLTFLDFDHEIDFSFLAADAPGKRTKSARRTESD